MGQDKLLQLINKAFRNDWTMLDLNNQGITAIPPEIGQLTNLKTLFINNNRLKAIPSEIGRLTNLNSLDLGG